MENSAKKNLRFTLISNGATLLLSLFVFKPFFEELDDTLSAMIMEGAFGQRDAHLVYSNYLLGVIESSLQGFFPSIRWHSVLQYGFMFICFCLVTYVLQQYKNGRILSIIFQMVSAFETYISLQFSKTATFVAGCVVFTLMILVKESLTEKGSRNKVENIVIIAASLLSFLYSVLLRYNGAEIVACLFGPLCVCVIIRHIKSNPRDIKWTRYLVCFVPLLVLVYILPRVSLSIYSTDLDWNAYLDYKSARALMVDKRYDALDYSKNEESLKKVGVSQNDAEMYLTYMFPDTEEIDADGIRDIIAAQPPKEAIGVVEIFKAWIRNIYDSVYGINALILGLILLLGATVLIQKKYYLECVMQSLILIVMLGYFQYSGRWNHRLVFSLCLVEVLAFIYVLIDENNTGKEDTEHKLYTLIIIVLAFCSCFQWLGNRFDYNMYMRERKMVDYDILQAYVEENKNILFCADTFTLQNIFNYQVFVPMREGQCSNVIACGSGITNSPITNGQTEHFGYLNPIQALKSCNDDVRLIDNNCPEKKALYLTEHGDGHVYSAKWKENIGGFDIYQME